jgi:hypothetical protein
MFGTSAAATNTAVDFSTVSAPDATKGASAKAAIGSRKTAFPTRTAVGGAALQPDEVKSLVTAYLPVAQNIVDSGYSKYIKSKPKLQLKFWTPEQLKATNTGNYDSVFAYVENTAPTVINVAYKSPIFQKFNLDADDAKALFLHEVFHTRSQAFTTNMADTYAPVNGKAATFSDGSQVWGISEGLTEVFTMASLNITSTPSGYSRETKWAMRLLQKVGGETVKKAYFGNDAASMVQVKNAINELIAADQRSPERSVSRSPSVPTHSRLRAVGIDRVS